LGHIEEESEGSGVSVDKEGRTVRVSDGETLSDDPAPVVVEEKSETKEEVNSPKSEGEGLQSEKGEKV
jgi:hypothetical protein